MSPLRLLRFPGNYIRTTLRFCPLLAVLLVAGFALRFSGVFWGLPPFDITYYHPDEPKIIKGACNFPHDITARADLRYPTACHYTLGLLTWPVKKVLESKGYSAYAFIYFTGRLLSVLLGTLGIFLVYDLGRRTSGRTHGLIAASLLCFAMYHATNSAWATTDVATSFLLVLFLALLRPALQHGSVRFARAAGVSLGMLIGAKYTGALAVVPLVILAVARHCFAAFPPTRRQVSELLSDRVLWTIGLTALLVFLITTPAIVIRPSALLSSIEYEQARMLRTYMPRYESQVWINVFTVFSKALGLPFAVSALLGLCMAVAGRKALDIALAALIVALVLYFGNSLKPRYLIMVTPVLALFAARAFVPALQAQRRVIRLAGCVLCAGVLLYSFYYSLSAAISRYPDTRSTAAEFIADSLPAGATIGIAYTSPRHKWPRHRWRYPDIDFDTFKYLDFLSRPDFVVVSSSDAQTIRAVISQKQLREDYTVPEHLAKQWYESSPPSPKIFRFFDELYFNDHGSYEMIASFAPERMLAPIEFPPPVIDIFKRRRQQQPDAGG